MAALGGLFVCIIIFFVVRLVWKISKWRAKKEYHKELDRKERDILLEERIRQLERERNELLKQKGK